MTKVQLLYHIWASFDPTKVCFCSSHYDRDRNPKPDGSVCERERAWRNYYQARDQELLMAHLKQAEMHS